MNLNYVPLLQIQLDLYKMPRGFARFEEYLRSMVDEKSGDLKLPLSAMNPMGKDHLRAFIEALFAFNADEVGARSAAEASAALQDQPGDFQVCLVVSDDLHGGWTNRFASEFAYRFDQNAYYKRGWITALLWTADSYDAELVRQEVLLTIFRAAYIQEHGNARSLREMLLQESFAMNLAGSPGSLLDAEDLQYTQEVLRPLMDATDRPTLIAALFGDAAAKELGYPTLGLSNRAGLALARSLTFTSPVGI